MPHVVKGSTGNRHRISGEKQGQTSEPAGNHIRVSNVSNHSAQRLTAADEPNNLLLFYLFIIRGDGMP